MFYQRFIATLTTMLLFFSFTPKSTAAWYDSPIDYQQAVSKILKRGDISWGDKADHYYNFSSVLVSADGSTVLFTGKCEFCSPGEVRPFLVNPDGSNLRDISGMLPSDIVNRWWAYRNLALTDDGSKLFFRAVVEAGYYDDEYFYLYDVASSTTTLALPMDEGFSPFASTWRFRIDASGSKLYMDEYDAGWSDTLEKHRKGLFYAETGGTRQWYFDVDDLPCDSHCGNLNMFKLLGVSKQNDRAFFHWNSDYSQTDDSNRHTGFYYTDRSGIPVRLSQEEYYSIYDSDPRGICDTEGNTAIYRYIPEYPMTHPLSLAVVDVASKTSRDVAWTYSLNGFSAHLSRSGRYVLVNGEYGDDGTYYQTLIDLDSDTSRDTWSYHMMSRWGSTSNITEDDRYFFYTYDNNDANSGLYRIDTRSTGDDLAPYVHSIRFSQPALLDEDDVAMAAQAKISAPGGLERIDRVTLLPLIDGQEDPAYFMGRAPLAFPHGDPGSTLLYDDGTHGDAVAGDGIFTFDGIATRRGSYSREEGGWNTWYYHNTLPASLGIRVVVRDKDYNYAIADTRLLIIDDLNDMPETPEPVDPDDPNDPNDPGDLPSLDETCAVIEPDLSISIPCAVFSHPFFGEMVLRLKLSYGGIDGGEEYVWPLDQFEDITASWNVDGAHYCGSIAPTLDQLQLPCALLNSPFGNSTWQIAFDIIPDDEKVLAFRLRDLIPQ